jgi:hypothetical protein
MMIPVKSPTQGELTESVYIQGDLAKLSPEQRTMYYRSVCNSLGLNPLTKPFDYITLNGKLQLYALRAATDQLRKINGVSLAIVSREIADGILTVHVRATLPDGRSDEDLGVVAFPETLKGEARANAELKAITKAKRRATLSICGLGWLDETEIADIHASAKRPSPPAPNVMLQPHDTKTGEIESAAEPADPAPASPSPATPAEAGAALSLEYMAQEAASRGRDVFDGFYKSRSRAEQAELRLMKPDLDRLFPTEQPAASQELKE